MKTLFIISIFCLGIATGVFAQKIDFSGYLASGGGVHTSTPSVVDKDGNIFVAGGTREGLKVTNDAFQKSYNGNTDEDVTGGDAFLMKLSPEGDLIYSTYIGGSKSENYCLKIALDDLGNVYVGFTTESPDLPVSKNAYQKSIKGENDHYIIKFSNDCRYIASTYLGGSGSDHWTTLAVHDNSLFLFGKTESLDFPTTKGAFQNEYDNSTPPDSSQSWMTGDITITSLSLNLDKVFYSTYLGGKSLDYIRATSFDSEGKIILVGATYSDNYPVTKNAYQKSMDGKQDGFLTILSQNLSKIDYSTYIGGDSTDQVNSVFVEDANNIILAGETKSPDFPVTSNALNGKYIGGNSDGFIMKFNLKLNMPVYSSFIGGSKTDQLKYIAMTDDEKYVLAGTSSSIDFPVTKEALYQSINGGMDLVLLILDKTLKNIEYSTYGGGSKQRMIDPIANYVNGGRLIVSSMCISPDFPATFKFAEPDNSWTNCIWKFDLKGKYESRYLGQTPPGNSPKPFPLFVNQGFFAAERIAISNDGKDIYYSEIQGYYPIRGENIKRYTFADGKWNGPFDLFVGFGPVLSLSGDTLYFERKDTENKSMTYISVRSGSGWGNPKRILTKLDKAHYYQITKTGNQYISSIAGNGAGLNDWSKIIITGTDTLASSLGRPLNTSGDNLDFFVSGDESYMIVTNRPALSISYKKDDGTWTNPRNFGPKINFGLGSWGPWVTRDNKYMFYSTGTKQDYSDVKVYWVRIDNVIDSLKNTNLSPYIKSLIQNQAAVAGQPFTFTVPDDIFFDDDSKTALKYSAQMPDGKPIPAWIVFNPATRSFSGTPAEAGELTFIVVVTDSEKAFAYCPVKIVISSKTGK
jgi:hypothetical protein